jgi:hypothetical protein
MQVSQFFGKYMGNQLTENRTVLSAFLRTAYDWQENEVVDKWYRILPHELVKADNYYR